MGKAGAEGGAHAVFPISPTGGENSGGLGVDCASTGAERRIGGAKAFFKRLSL